MTKDDSGMHEIQSQPADHVDTESTNKKLKYPKSVFFIILNEFCERFSFYGMRTILTLYLRNKLAYDDNTSIIVYHVFTMFVYFFPLIGAMLADSLLGKFRTIFYLSLIYALGQILLSITAVPSLGLPLRGFSLLGLFLIAVGTGGIKPCVAAFGGDQFVLPQQERYLAIYFSLFYFSINSGSLISSFITPIIRSEISCFGDSTCYSLAFFIPAILMILSIVIFVIGKPLYKITKPKDNVVWDVTKCVSHAISNKIKSKKGSREHWLDHADDAYDKQFINDIKASLRVLKLFIPLPFFWALYDQQGSKWTIQATRMDGEIGSFLMQADQMQVVNPLLIVIFIPIFETCIYPLLSKVNLVNTPLKKLATGGLLAVLSFVISGLIELKLEPTYPVLPSKGYSQLRLYNTMGCDIDLNLTLPNLNKSVKIDKLGMWEDKRFEAYQFELRYEANLTKCKTAGFTTTDRQSGTIFAFEEKATSWVFTPNGFGTKPFEEVLEKSKTGDPLISSMIYVSGVLPKNSTLKLSKANREYEILFETYTITDKLEVKPGIYDILIDGNTVETGVKLKLGGIYNIVGYLKQGANHDKTETNVITITDPNSVHIAWLLPQYIVITMAEVMFSVTGLEFAFTQAPESMKSVLQASWLLTVAFGNLIVILVAEASFFDRQLYEFLLFAGLMLIDIIIFMIMTTFYKYVEPLESKSDENDIGMEAVKGRINPTFKEDEKDL